MHILLQLKTSPIYFHDCCINKRKFSHQREGKKKKKEGGKEGEEKNDLKLRNIPLKLLSVTLPKKSIHCTLFSPFVTNWIGTDWFTTTYLHLETPTVQFSHLADKKIQVQ